MIKKHFVLFLYFFLSLSAGKCFSAALQPRLKNVGFVNQNGKPFQLYDFKGHPLFVSFIFTRCSVEKMCPLTVTLNKALFKKLQNLKTHPKLHFLLVTLDPAFDNPAVLKKYAQTRNLDARYFTLATGNSQALSDFASEFNVMGIPSEGTVSHNTKSILVNSEMIPMKEFKDNEWNPKEVLQLLPIH